MTNRDKILALLRAHIAQRPGMDPRNYGDAASYRSESRGITQDRHDAEMMLRQVEQSSITDAALWDAFRGSRLTIVQGPNGPQALDYCTGQYFPTEYRRAACAVLASALWTAARENAPVDAGFHEPHSNLRNLGDYLRAHFRRVFGARIARRYFN